MPMTAESLFEGVLKGLQGRPGVAQAKMFGALGLKANEKYFAMLYKGKLVLKLPKERVEALVASGQGQYFDPGHGRLMKEWVAVPPSGGSQWRSLAEEGLAFAAVSQGKTAERKKQ